MDLCQLVPVLDVREILDDSKTTVIVPIFNRKDDVRSCGLYRGVKLLNFATKIVEKVLEKQIAYRHKSI